MKTFTLIIFNLLLTQSIVWSQAKEVAPRGISENFQNTALKQVFTLLKNKYGIKSAYGEKNIKDIKISCKLTNSTVQNAFTQILYHTDLEFEMIESDLIIIKKQKKLKGDTQALYFDLLGSVQDVNSGESLPHAYVWLENDDRSLLTNIDGYFSLARTKLPASIKISYLGYRDTTILISQSSIDKKLNILLTPKSENLKEVIINDVMTDDFLLEEIDGKITFNPSIASSIPSTGEVDVFRSLQLLPGINASNEISSGLSVRGGTTNQNLVLFDGFTVYHVDHFFGYFSAFNPFAIKTMRIFKSGYGAEYGGRVSSIIDITGKDGNRHNTSGSLALNLLSINSTLEIPITENNTTLFFSARRSYTDIITTPLFDNIFSNFSSALSSNGSNPNQGSGGNMNPKHPSGEGGMNINNQAITTNKSTINPEFYYSDVNVKISSNISDKNRVSLSLYNSRDILNFTENASNTVNDTLDIESKTIGFINWGNIGSSLKFSRLWNSNHFSNALLSYSKYSSAYNDISTSISTGQNSTTTSNASTEQDNGMQDISFKLDHEWQLSNANRLTFGLNASLYSTVYTNIVDNESIVNENQNDKTLSNAYAQYYFEPLPNLSLNIGLRGSYFSPTDRFYLVPRISANLKLNEQVHLKASYGQYNQFINQTNTKNVLQGSRDFWLLANDDDIPVQHAAHYSMGLSYQNNGLVMSVDTYAKQFDGLLEYAFSNGGLVTEFENFDELFYEGSGYASGMEFLIKKNTRNYQAWVSYTLSQVIYSFEDINDGKSFYADHDRRHEVNVYASYKFKNFELFATWIYGTGNPYSLINSAEFASENQMKFESHVSVLSVDEKNAQRLPVYHRLDIGATYFFMLGNMKAETTLSIFNLYNRENIQDRRIKQIMPGFQSGKVHDKPILQSSDVTLLGISPNISMRISF